jgi:SAM-dependent methyltransferase
VADARLDPPYSMPTYAVRAPLATWLQAAAREAYAELGSYRLLDVGCGQKPYRPFFDPYVSEYVGLDFAEGPQADLIGPIEALPVPDGAFDVVLCTQVLEHADDPVQAVKELYRVTAPGGRVLLSTHGVMVYHPNPVDYWRWTHEGLTHLFRGAGEWASVTVTAGSGTTACVAMLVAIYLDHTLRRARLRFLRRPLIGTLNRAAARLDGLHGMLREPRAGTIAANYSVVAVKAR